MKAQPTPYSSAELLSHSRWIHSLALRLVRDAAQADDLVQETFLAALERRPRADRPLRPWLRRVLMNRAAFWRRGESRRRARERDCAAPRELPSSETLLERAEIHGQIVQALTALRDPYRTTLLLRYYEGLEPSEIARRRDVPAGTVRSQLKRGIDELRAELDGRFEGDRRRWALAAVPFAARAEGASEALGVGFKLAVVAAAGVLAATAIWRVTRPAPGGPPAAGPGAPVAPVATPGAADDERVALAPPVEEADASSTPRRRAEPVSEATNEPDRAPSAQAPQESAPLAGVVLDRATGRPVPDYAIELDDGERDPELVRSDDEGRFESARAYPAGELRIDHVDHPDLIGIATYGGGVQAFGPRVAGSIQWRPGQAPIERRVTVGPTYPLAIEAPFPWRSMPLEGSLQSSDASEEAGPGNWSLHGPVRGEEEPWVRFQPLHGILPMNSTWSLRLVSDDGLWAGEAEVASGEGVYPETVEVELVERARLELRLVSATPLADPAVTLEALSDGTRRSMKRGDRGARDGGEETCGFELGAIPAGEHRVLVRIEGAELPRAVVRLAAGEVVRRDLEVGSISLVGRVRGELRSDSGSFRELTQIQLSGAGRLFQEQPEWRERDGRWVAPFAFENVPPGDYELRLVPRESYHRWEPPAPTPLPARGGRRVHVPRHGADEGPRHPHLQAPGPGDGGRLPRGARLPGALHPPPAGWRRAARCTPPSTPTSPSAPRSSGTCGGTATRRRSATRAPSRSRASRWSSTSRSSPDGAPACTPTARPARCPASRCCSTAPRRARRTPRASWS